MSSKQVMLGYFRQLGPKIGFLFLMMVLAGCGFTAIKRDPSLKYPYEERAREHRTASEQRRLRLCKTFAGKIISPVSFRNTVSTDSILSLSILEDGSWVLANHQGTFRGTWTFTDRNGIVYFNMKCSCRKREFNSSFIVYFKDWGIQLFCYPPDRPQGLR